MTALKGVAIQKAGTLYAVPTELNANTYTVTLASNTAEGLMKLLGNDVFFKFQNKAFELAPNARMLTDVPLEAVVEALKFACGAESGEVKELVELPKDEGGPTYR